MNSLTHQFPKPKSMQFEARQFHGNFFREYDQKKENGFREGKLGFVKKYCLGLGHCT